MAEGNGDEPRLSRLMGSLVRAGVGLLRNRGELLVIELQEEKIRLVELLFFAFTCLFLGYMGVGLVTAVVIFLFSESLRLYVAGAFAVLYLCGAVWAGFRVKAAVSRAPFPESLQQLKKDREWLESSR